MWRDESATVPLPSCPTTVVRDPWYEHDDDDDQNDRVSANQRGGTQQTDQAAAVRLSPPASSIAECVKRTVRDLCAGAAAAAKTPTQWLVDLLSRSLHTPSSQSGPLLLTWHDATPRPTATPALATQRRPRLRDEHEPSRLLLLEPVLKKLRRDDSAATTMPNEQSSSVGASSKHSSLQTNGSAAKLTTCGELPSPCGTPDDGQPPPRKKSRLSEALRAALRFPLPKTSDAPEGGVAMSPPQLVVRGSPRTPTTCAAVLRTASTTPGETFDRRKRPRSEGCA